MAGVLLALVAKLSVIVTKRSKKMDLKELMILGGIEDRLAALERRIEEMGIQTENMARALPEFLEKHCSNCGAETTIWKVQGQYQDQLKPKGKRRWLWSLVGGNWCWWRDQPQGTVVLEPSSCIFCGKRVRNLGNGIGECDCEE